MHMALHHVEKPYKNLSKMESLEMPFPANPTFQPPQEIKVLEYLFFCNTYFFVKNKIYYIKINISS